MFTRYLNSDHGYNAHQPGSQRSVEGTNSFFLEDAYKAVTHALIVHGIAILREIVQRLVRLTGNKFRHWQLKISEKLKILNLRNNAERFASLILPG